MTFVNDLHGTLATLECQSLNTIALMDSYCSGLTGFLGSLAGDLRQAAQRERDSVNGTA